MKRNFYKCNNSFRCEQIVGILLRINFFLQYITICELSMKRQNDKIKPLYMSFCMSEFTANIGGCRNGYITDRTVFGKRNVSDKYSSFCNLDINIFNNILI